MRAFSAIFAFILDTIAPEDPEIRRIGGMSPAEFLHEARKTQSEPDIDGVISFLPYRSKIVKRSLVELKSYGNKKIARLLGSLLSELLVAEFADLEAFGNFTEPLVVPIPITGRRRRERGFNQCELMLEGAGGLHIRTKILAKIRETEDQVGKSRQERLENLKGAFRVRDPETIRGKNVVIVDDIVTTGATLLEARRALRQAGARKVVCIALAH